MTKKSLLINVGYIVVVVATYIILLLALLPPSFQANPVTEVAMVTFPYLAGGIFLGLVSISSFRRVLVLSLLTTLCERLLILFFALNVLWTFRQIDETGTVSFTEGTGNILIAIQTEALPYFSLFYVLMGIPLSFFVTYISARLFYHLTEAMRRPH